MDPIRFLIPLIRPVTRRVVARKTAEFAELPPQPGRVVFLGDSITEGGAWDEFFPDLRCLRRGVGGDSVGGVRGRLGSALHEPTAVSLLIGTNDLHGLGKTRDVDEIAEQFQGLVGEIRAAAPDAVLFVNSVTPRTASWVEKIHALNLHYVDIAAGADATYVDLWPALAADDGSLRKEFTRDRLHLTMPGYQAWVKVLQPHLEEFAEG